MKKKAVIYGRVSTADKQEYDRQIDDLMRYANANNYEVVETFTEKVSGRATNRPEYDRMIAFMRENKRGVKNILVTELSRFGRLGTKTELALEELAEAGINTYIQDLNQNTIKDGKVNDDGFWIIGLLCKVAKKEVETLANRIKSGLRHSASQNGALSGKYPPYGFRSENKKLVVDVDEMKIVNEMFELYKSGFGCSKIAYHLNVQGVKCCYNKKVGEGTIKTKNGYEKKGNDFSWSSGTIISTLKNPLYKGERWHKEELVGTFDPPISPNLFDQVQATMKRRNNRPIRMVKNDNHLKGIIFCGVCGCAYYIHKRKDGKDEAFKCLSKKLKYDGKAEYCGSPSIGIKKLVDSLYIVASKTIIAKLRASKSSRQSENETKIHLKVIESNSLRNEVKKFESKLSNLYDDYNERLVSKSVYSSKQNEFETAKEKTQQQLDNILIELKNLEDGNSKKVHDSYTKANFLREIRNVLSKITISKAIKNKSTDRIFSKADTLISVNVSSIVGEKFSYVLSRYSDKLHVVGSNFKVTRSMKGDDHKGFDLMYDFGQIMDKIISPKRTS